jgi:transposase
MRTGQSWSGAPGRRGFRPGRAGCTEPTVIKWRRRYAESGLAGLEDAPRGGGPVTVLTGEAVGEILAATMTPPPEPLRARGVTHWSARRLADWLRTDRDLAVSHDSVIRVWHRFGLQSHRTEGFKFSADPQLDAKVRGVVGLDLAPPGNAVVVCLDEKSPVPGAGADSADPAAAARHPRAAGPRLRTARRGQSVRRPWLHSSSRSWPWTS